MRKSFDRKQHEHGFVENLGAKLFIRSKLAVMDGVWIFSV